MYTQRLLTLLLVSMLISACTQFKPYRTTLPAKSATKYFECRVDAAVRNPLNLPLCDESESAESQAIQHRFYRTSDGNQGEDKRVVEGDYYLSFVEFDDQGWFANRKQMKALFALLEDIEKKDKESGGHTLIQVYAHGWKHNASACDNNVLCFSRLLERTDLAEKSKEVMRYIQKGISELTEEQKQGLEGLPPEEQTLAKLTLNFQKLIDLKDMGVEERMTELDEVKPRTVVGVYLGWRGLPFDTALNNLSFWSRKDTAARVGSGGVFELLTRLKDYRDSRQREASTDPYDKGLANTNKTQLVITGHSFGGLVIYSALSHALMERAAKTQRPTMTDKLPDPVAEYGIANSFGDFVLLVNPAFEGSLYEPLFNISTNRCYRKKQLPVMMIVTSKADKATGFAFPVGRALDTLFQHEGSAEQGDSMRKTIGHNERYKTHDLKLEGRRNTLDEKYAAKRACDCPHLRPTSELTLDQMQGDSFDAMLNENYGNGLSLVPVATMRLQQNADPRQSAYPKYARNYPYLVVTTDASVIADHNAIYNGNFTLFTQQFLQKHITLEQPLPAAPDSVPCWPEEKVPSGLLPIERSCDNGGKPCSAQTVKN